MKKSRFLPSMRNLLFLNKYHLCNYKITSLNNFYRISDNEKVLVDSCNSKKMWDNIKFKISTCNRTT